MASALGKAILEIVTDAGQFFSGLGQVDARVKSTAAGLRKFGGDASSLGRQLTAGVTLPLAAIAAGAVKIGSDFESSFAGVRKTVDATEPEFAKMSQGFRDLAKTIPVNVDALNDLGAEAGALGIPKEQLVDFARVMAELGVTTNLTADQAADSIAHIQNIFGAAGQDTERLASTIVDLGNKGASTEQEITEMAQRIAGAGHTVGLSQAQVAGLASTLASVGIEAEAGGTVISKALLTINNAVGHGGDALEDYARVAGMSADQFAEAFRTNASGALAAFITGLQQMKANGDNVSLTIQDLFGKQVRMTDVMLRLVGSGHLLHDQLAVADKAWQSNTALTAEAEQRFATTQSQVQLLANNLRDLAIEVWPTLRQVVKDFLAVAVDLLPVLQKVVEWFINMPAPARDITVAVGGLAVALGPILIIVGQIASAFGVLLPYLPALGEAIAALGTAVTGPIGLILAAVVGLGLAWHTWGDDVTAVVTKAYTDVKTWLWDNLQPVLEPLIGLLQSLGAAWEAFSRLVGAVAKAVIDAHIELVTKVTLWLVDKLLPIFKPIGDGMRNLQTVFTTVKEAVVLVAQRLYEGVKSWILDKFVGIVDKVKGQIDRVTGFFNDLYEKVVGHSYVVDLWDGIRDQFARAVPAMVNPSQSSTGQVAGHFQTMQLTVGGTVTALWTGVQSTFATGLESIVSGSGSMRDRLVGVFKDLQGKVLSVVNSLVSQMVSRFVQGFLNILTGAGSFGSAFAGILGGGVAAGGAAGAGGAGAAGGAGGIAGAGALGTAGTIGAEFAFPLVAGHLVNPGPLVTPPVPESEARAAAEAYFGPDYERYAGPDFDWSHVFPGQIPGLANGGIVDRPMLAALAERGRPEAIIPLDKIGRYMGGDRPLKVDVYLDGQQLARNQVKHIPRVLFGAGY